MSKRPPEDDSFIDKILKEFDASIDDVDMESKIAMKDALKSRYKCGFLLIFGMEPDIEVFDGERQDVWIMLTIRRRTRIREKKHCVLSCRF